MYGGILFSGSPCFRESDFVSAQYLENECIGYDRAWYNKTVVGWVIEYRKGRL